MAADSKHGSDRAAGISLLDPLHQAAGQACSLRQLRGSEFAFDAGCAG